MLSDKLRVALVEEPPISYAFHAYGYGDGTSATIPSTVNNGDIIVYSSVYYSNTIPASPSGYTTIYSSLYLDAYQGVRVGWKVATTADRGTSINGGNRDNSFIVIRPSRTPTGIAVHSSGAIVGNSSSGSQTASAPASTSHFAVGFSGSIVSYNSRSSSSNLTEIAPNASNFAFLYHAEFDETHSETQYSVGLSGGFDYAFIATFAI